MLKETTPYLRPMKEYDLLEVAGIERDTFPDPWPLSSFRECLIFGYHCCVLDGSGVIQGYGVMSIEIDSAHILNLCVRPEFRQCGGGRKMLSHLLQLAETAQVEAVFLEVRVSNQPAINLYQSMGFVEIGVRKNYYPGENGREDALILVRRSRTQK
ncbi:ribosomal protein S18-alanine N-acetyltransferase [Acidobacteria bacterium AH-259-D05]|nr:ribosomal protein S18-alanine N-acetyltransferase [Acidobacteria bacterium AH-259-D05]